MVIFHAFRIKKIYIVQLSLFCLLGFFVFIKFSSITNPVSDVGLIRGNTDEATIALTFNIVWGDDKVNTILQTLKESNTRATFFVSGEWAERHPHIIQEILDGKHELGTLGYRYQNYLKMDDDQIRKDILYTQHIFKKLGYENAQYIRPPEGKFNENILNLIESLGLKAIMWSVNGFVQDSQKKNDVAKQIIKSTDKGDIITFDASDSAKYTSEILTMTIPELEKNFDFVTISELYDAITTELHTIE